jgi:hypothetical protein
VLTGAGKSEIYYIAGMENNRINFLDIALELLLAGHFN